MWKDPIVEELHRVREEIARQNNFDLDTLISALQEQEKQHKDRVVSLEKSPSGSDAHSQ